jgi:WD40 repeat protein
VAAAVFGDRGDRIAVAHTDGRVAIWDALASARSVEMAGHDGGASRVQFCGGDGRLMSAGHDGTVKLWDTATGKLLRSIVLKPGYLAPLVTPDCAFLISSGDGHPLAILDATDGRLLDHIEVRSGETLRVAMSRDGHQLAAASGQVAWLWDLHVERDMAPLLEIVHCAVPYRIEGSELVAAAPDPHCARR